MVPMIEIGTKAPDFKLLNQDGNAIQLKNFKGKKSVVLYFYPKAMTPGCTVQACGLRDSKSWMESSEVVILGVSPDLPAKLSAFRKKEKLNFELLSDPDHKVAELYGAWGQKKNYGKEYMGIIRSTFIIGKDGKVKHVMAKVNTKTHHEDVMGWIEENLK